jgi:hypothetical protein
MLATGSQSKSQGSHAMSTYEVTMGRAGGGSAAFRVIVHGNSVNDARRAAEAQNPNFKAQAIKQVWLKS